MAITMWIRYQEVSFGLCNWIYSDSDNNYDNW